MLPMPGDELLVHQERLELHRLRDSISRREVDPRDRVVDRVQAERRQLGRLLGQLVGCADEQLAEGAGVDEAQLAALRERDTTWVCFGAGSLRGSLQQLAAHAQVDDQQVAGVELEQQVLALAVDAGDLGALEPRDELLLRAAGGPCACRDTSTVLIRLPTTSRSRSRRMVSTSGSSGIELVPPIRLVGPASSSRSSLATPTAAAACSACFFDRPSPSPRDVAPDSHHGEEPLRVVGTLVADS